MTTENICTLCPGRTCVNQGTGRIVNDADKQHPLDTSKIHFDVVPIDKCDLKDSMEMDDRSDLLLGC